MSFIKAEIMMTKLRT